jgi:hypothetical protein
MRKTVTGLAILELCKPKKLPFRDEKQSIEPAIMVTTVALQSSS